MARADIGSQFGIAKALITDLFIYSGFADKATADTQIPPAAELISALLLMTPQMSEFLRNNPGSGLTEDDQIRMVALIMGRGHGLTVKTSGTELHLDFVRRIISGEVDADKLDYVARDAYFAGIPIAADVHRLINQLDIIQVENPDKAAGGKVAILAILSTGVATVEMFILTRGYLFDRIYQHPKIRAAEGVLERALSQYNQAAGSKLDDFFKFIYHDGGDDYCIGVLSEQDAIRRPNSSVSLANRRLPRRVLAISPRFLVGFNSTRRDMTAMLRGAWDRAVTDIPSNTSDLEMKISSLTKPDSMLMIDMPRKSALKENLELYVRRGGVDAASPPEDISRHFDAAQFSAAYEHIKKTIWVFSDHPDPARVAAGAALTFMTQYGLVPTDDGLIAAKINLAEFSRALDRLASEDSGNVGVIVEELRHSRGESLTVPLWLLERSLAIGDKQERFKAAELLANALEGSGLTKQSLDDLDAALVAVRWLFKHESTTADAEKRHNLSLVEDDFQKSVGIYLKTHAVKDVDPEKESDNTAGRADYALRMFDGRIQIALEMKAEEELFEKIIEKRLAQPFHYATDTRFARIAILYVRFRDDRTRRPVEDFSVKVVPNARSPLLLICIGQRTTSNTASQLPASTAKA